MRASNSAQPIGIHLNYALIGGTDRCTRLNAGPRQAALVDQDRTTSQPTLSRGR